MKVVRFRERPPAFLYFPLRELYEIVFESNGPMLGIGYYAVDEFERIARECIEFFTDPEYPGMLLVDIYYGGPSGLKGCFYVAAGTYKLIQLSAEPLRHFQ
jgi:hypothetical protein